MNILLNTALLAVALLLSGCSPLMQASVDTFKAAALGAEPVELTQAQVEAVPYPQIKVTTPTSEGVMAKVRQRGDLEFWVASGKQTLLIRDGLVVRSIGLIGGVDGTRFDGESPFKRGLQTLPEGFTSTRWIDLYEGDRVGLTVHSRFERKALETVPILEREFVLLRVDEHIEIAELGFSAVNRYWVEPETGLIRWSEQHLSPDLVLRIVQIRPDREMAR